MLLAIDSGNTNIVFAVFSDDGKVVRTWRLDTHSNVDFGLWMLDQGLVASDITAAIIATVVPRNLEPLIELCEVTLGVEPLVVGHDDVDLGVEVLLDTPSEIGADRLVNAVAAGERYGGSLICVDFGTATTFDILDKNKNYAGGVIAPGINLSLEALHAHAAKLPRVEPKRPERVIGTSTISAMQSGIYWGYVSLIEGMVKRIKIEFGSPMTVIATGGLSPLFSPAIDAIETIDTDLTLRGLFLIYQRNRST
ncbi:MAG: type III pantothenate kinase [Magnetovibrio sp.]|nr:type III pantothenate kinase [Magnetovibrio sp.]